VQKFRVIVRYATDPDMTSRDDLLQIRTGDEGVDILQWPEIGGLADLVPDTRYVAGEARQKDPAAPGML